MIPSQDGSCTVALGLHGSSWRLTAQDSITGVLIQVQTSQYGGEVFVSQQQIFLEVSAWRLISQELFNIFMGVLSENNFLTFALFFLFHLNLRSRNPDTASRDPRSEEGVRASR